MGHIVVMKKGEKRYYAEMESYRQGGKVKKRMIHYYGRTDPRKNPAAMPIIKSSVSADYRFGDAALLYKAAQEIEMINVVDKYVPKRQGLSLGLELFLTAAHRLLDDKPSSHNLARWVQTTHLPLLLNFDASNITDNTQQYLMDKIYDEEKNIDHLYRISIDLYNNALKLFGKEEDVFFYDITSTYFEGKCCPLAFFGHNKDGKLDKLQINIAMIMNGKYGLPVVSKVFKGNVGDARTLHEMVYYPKVIMKKEKCMLIMDRGFDSEDNVRLMDTTRYDYILGMSAKHKFVKKLKTETDFSSGSWDTINNDGNVIKLRKVTKNVFGKRRTVILYYSQKVAGEQKERRDFRIQNAMERLENQGKLTMEKANEIAKRVRKYLVLEQNNEKEISWRIDKVKLNRAEKNDGKFCLMTNKDIEPKDVFAIYFSKDKIEKGFRHMKQDANMRPVHKRLADHVIVDVFVCHIAYLLMRVADHFAQQEKIGISWDGLSSEAKEIRLISYKTHSGGQRFQIVANNDIQKNIVDKMELSKQLPVYTTKPK